LKKRERDKMKLISLFISSHLVFSSHLISFFKFHRSFEDYLSENDFSSPILSIIQPYLPQFIPFTSASSTSASTSQDHEMVDDETDNQPSSTNEMMNEEEDQPSSSIKSDYSLLGLGDIVVPGRKMRDG